jgi:hypothetical protein
MHLWDEDDRALCNQRDLKDIGGLIWKSVLLRNNQNKLSLASGNTVATIDFAKRTT